MTRRRYAKLARAPSHSRLAPIAGDGLFVSPGSEFGRAFVAPDGVTIDWNVAPQEDGQYVSFWPSGRTDSAAIRVTGPNGEVTQVACLSATETFHVLNQQELNAGYGIR